MTAAAEVRQGAEAGRLVLVADGNTGRGRRLVEECRTAGFDCRLAPHGAAALELALAARPAVVVAQIDLPLVDAFKLSEILRANPRTRAARFLFLGPGESLAGRGSVGDRLLPSDTRPDALVSAIEDLLEKQGRIDTVGAASGHGGRVQGDLAKLSLADLLQNFLINRRSGRLELVSTGEDGSERGGLLLMRDGDVIQAEVGVVDGEKALFRMLSWRQGSFVFRGGRCEEPPSILVPTRRLLVEGMRQLEEWDRLSPRLPPLDAPVRL